MKKIIKYAVVILFGLVIGFLIANSKDVFEAETKKEVFHILSDSFFVPGIIITGIGLLIYASDEGVFDGIVYGVQSFINMFRSKYEKKYNSYFEYKQQKHATKTKIGFILISGLFILSIAIIMYVLYTNA